KFLEFPHDEWFKLNVHVNLDLNYWRVSVNDASQSAFINGVNALASMDLFPVNPDGTSQFYIDDIGFTHDPYMAPALDALMANVEIKGNTVSGSEVIVRGTVKNAGTDAITSLDIVWSDGVNEYTDNLSSLNIP
ncbi:hypothetical protein RZS08_31330, partial [Arthrospira platensis SPKY1]|nr:hypothetical protein [Arthrospira platensis SPKY1]